MLRGRWPSSNASAETLNSSVTASTSSATASTALVSAFTSLAAVRMTSLIDLISAGDSVFLVHHFVFVFDSFESGALPYICNEPVRVRRDLVS